VITNVPGPQVPLYNTGAKMLSNLGTGPVLDSVGLFHVISSYCGEFSISITSCRDLMPDPEFYRQCLQDSFEELLAATVESAPVRRKTARKKAPAKKAKAKPLNAATGGKKTGRVTRAGVKPKTAANKRKAG